MSAPLVNPRAGEICTDQWPPGVKPPAPQLPTHSTGRPSQVTTGNSAPPPSGAPFRPPVKG